jgi:hypothetical protein
MLNKGRRAQIFWQKIHNTSNIKGFQYDARWQNICRRTERISCSLVLCFMRLQYDVEWNSSCGIIYNDPNRRYGMMCGLERRLQ